MRKGQASKESMRCRLEQLLNLSSRLGSDANWHKLDEIQHISFALHRMGVNVVTQTRGGAIRVQLEPFSRRSELKMAS